MCEGFALHELSSDRRDEHSIQFLQIILQAQLGARSLSVRSTSSLVMTSSYCFVKSFCRRGLNILQERSLARRGSPLLSEG
ncbi:hypothetical protein KP509_35G062800 [Ceratopteris richardii]|uniref:Uncharacterized protein n=1 Tax=Ceratopteris richardii TaxID=49495 RepID=A0A8T2QHQ6_CERRI|nr:hypothetical protein KP509_35G062800 [Ceratopteris richardii]